MKRFILSATVYGNHPEIMNEFKSVVHPKLFKSKKEAQNYQFTFAEEVKSNCYWYSKKSDMYINIVECQE